MKKFSAKRAEKKGVLIGSVVNPPVRRKTTIMIDVEGEGNKSFYIKGSMFGIVDSQNKIWGKWLDAAEAEIVLDMISDDITEGRILPVYIVADAIC